MATEATSLRNELLVMVEVKGLAACPYCCRVAECKIGAYGTLELKASCAHAVGAERVEGGLFIQFARSR